jgi:ribose 5-phosphate isomerase B
MASEFHRRTFMSAAGISLSGTAQRNAGPRKPPMKLAIGSDHAGFPMKGPVVQILKSWGHSVKDCGSFTPEPVDFPDIAAAVCEEVKSGRAQRGIMVCGTGVGASIAANKVNGIRAALCHDVYSAHQCVEHDDVNVLCMGAWIIGIKVAEEILAAYLNAEFSTSEEFRRRVRKLGEMERKR